MADTVVKQKNEHEITLSRLQNYLPPISVQLEKITPFQNAVFHSQQNIFDVFSHTETSDSILPEQNLVNAILYPERTRTSEFEKKTLTSVQAVLEAASLKNVIEKRSLDFAELLQRIHSLFLDEFKDEDTSSFSDLRQNYLRNWNSLSGVLIHDELKLHWTAYPLFFLRFVQTIDAFQTLILAKIEAEYQALDDFTQKKHEQDIKKLREKAAKESGAFMTLVSATSGAGSTEKEVGQSGSTIRNSTDALNEKFTDDIKSLYSLIGTLDRDHPLSFTDFKEKYSSNFAILRQTSGTDSFDAALKKAFIVQGKNHGWKIDEISGDLIDRGSGSIRRDDQSSAGDILSQATLPQLLKDKLRTLSMSTADLTQIEAAFSEIEQQVEAGRITTPQEVRVRVQRLLPSQNQLVYQLIQDSIRLPVVTSIATTTASSQSPTSLQQYLETEPGKRKTIEQYAVVAAYFETVPPELIERLRRELPTTPPFLRAQLQRVFEQIRTQEQGNVLRLTNGKLFALEDFPNFGRSDLELDIHETKVKILEQLVGLRGAVNSNNVFHKVLSTPLSANRVQLIELETKHKSIADKRSEAFKIAIAAYQEQLLITQIQENFLTPDKQSGVPILRPQSQEWTPDVPLAKNLGFAEYVLATGSQASQSDHFEFITQERTQNQAQVRSRLNQVNSGAQRVRRATQYARKLMANPLYAAGAIGVGVGVGSLLSSLTNAALLAATSFGGVAGAIGGALIGGVPGAAIGFGLGSAAGNLLGRAFIPGAGGSISQSVTQVAGSLAKSAPGTLVNATGSLGGVGGGVGNIVSNTVNTSLTTAGNAISGISGVTSSLPVTGLFVAVIPLTVVGLLTITGRDKAFLVPSDVASCVETNGISVCKSADIVHSQLPVPITYTISIKAKSDSSGKIESVKDSFEVRKSVKDEADPPVPVAPPEILNSLVGKTVDANTTQTITYTIPFGAEYADTQIINNFSVGISASGQSKLITATANVIFGQIATSGAGCWPTTGTINQGPFSEPTHCRIDAIDIFSNSEGGPNAPVFSPFAGSAQFFCLEGTCPYVNSLPIYGNSVLLTLDNGDKLMFGHMSRFADGFKGGDKIPITAGTQLGFMGNSGSGLPGAGGGNCQLDDSCKKFSEHLHYEYQNNTIARSCSDRPKPGSKLFSQGLVPEPILTDESVPRGVPGIQNVRPNQCGSSTGPTTEGKEVGRVGCFSFRNGSKEWKPEELSQYKAEMTKLLAQPNMANAICGDQKTIPIERYEQDPDRTNEGCEIQTPGEGVAEWVGSTLYVCDLLFANPTKFGVYTMWHEPGHAFQHKHPQNWQLFKDFGAGLYLKSYPLTSSYVEDFAESFGFCSYAGAYNPDFLLKERSLIFRGVSMDYTEYAAHCSELNKAIQSVPIAPDRTGV